MHFDADAFACATTKGIGLRGKEGYRYAGDRQDVSRRWAKVDAFALHARAPGVVQHQEEDLWRRRAGSRRHAASRSTQKRGHPEI